MYKQKNVIQFVGNMKNLLLIISAFLLLSFTPSSTYKPCGKYNGKNIYEGKDGGCYYLKGKEHRKI